MDDKILLEEFVKTVKKEVDKLGKYLLINPINKDKIDELQLDSRFYNVIYTELIEKNKIYVVNKEDYRYSLR